jgi:MFS family permease
MISAILGIGGGLGLVLGGLLVDHTSYHLIFWLGAAMALLAAVATELYIPESPVRQPGRVDWRGAIVLSIGLVGPLYAISQANKWGWASARTLGLIAFGLAVLAIWVWLERRTESPLANVRTLGKPVVMMTNLATLFVGFGMFGSFLLIPQLAEAPTATGYGFGLDATGAGLLMLPGALAMLFIGPLSGTLGGRYGSKVPLTIGAAVTTSGLLLLGLAHGTHLEVLLGSFVMSVGIGFAFAAMPNLIVDAVPLKETGEATGFNALVRSVGSSLGSQVSAAILAGTAIAGIPTNHGYTAAFLTSAGVALAATVVAASIPARTRARVQVVAPR